MVLDRLIRWWMGGYREQLSAPAPDAPTRLGRPRRAAVIGGGIAGICAATALAERGFQVTLFEAEPQLGGRAGSDLADLDGEPWQLDHGFHAFFYQYYNLWRFLDKVGARPRLKPIGDYVILGRDGRQYRFADVARPPLLNILSLVRRGLPRLREVMGKPQMRELLWLLRYEESSIYARFDDLPFADFCRRLDLPPALQLVFTTLGRSFFTDPERLSTAALLQSFHFYFLSHDLGLLYDYLDDDYQAALIEPIRRYWADLPLAVRAGEPVERVAREGEELLVAGERFDAAILAVDAPAAARIVAASGLDPRLEAQLAALPPATGCAVYRLWMDADVGGDLPVFVSTERLRVLDAVSFAHRVTPQARAWAQRTGGGLYELHSYAVPEGMSDDELREAMREDFLRYFPALAGAATSRERFALNRRFSALHTGLRANRPGTRTGVPGLFLAGDWLKLPTPALLMEAACTSGLLAANAVLAESGLQEEPIESVPRRGLFARR